MRTSFLIALFILCASVNASEINHITLEKYDFSKEHSFRIPTDFAGHFVIDSSGLSDAKKGKIYLIELVYTRYKSSPNFDQNALNENRVSELKKLIPQVSNADIVWNFIEQTGALTRDEAKTYYHGFVIHYENQTGYQELSNYFEEIQKPLTSYSVDNSSGATFTYESGTKLFIPANAVTNKDGSPVSGNYEIVYREFRNPAEIALSGIPMTFHDGKESFNFNSQGMFEINGVQNGKELTLVKDIQLQFECTEKAPNVNYYVLDESGKWEYLQPVSFYSPNRNTNQERFSVKFQDLQDDFSLAMMSKSAWESYKSLKSRKPFFIRRCVVAEYPDRMHVKIKSIHQDKFYRFIAQGNYKSSSCYEQAYQNYSETSTVLRASGFGVYNCDQVKRIENQLAIYPEYIDKNTGKPIENTFMVSLIDYSYNASFSFSPGMVVCNSMASNSLILFTSEKDVYFLSKEDFANAGIQKQYIRIELENITDKVSSPNDLKEILGV